MDNRYIPSSQVINIVTNLIKSQASHDDIYSKIISYCKNKYISFQFLIIALLLKLDGVSQKIKDYIIGQFCDISEVKNTLLEISQNLPQDFINEIVKLNNVVREVSQNALQIENNEVVDCLYKDVVDVIIPTNVTSIGKDAFRNCKSLQSITIPNSVTSIGESAFIGCESLQSIIIPASVTSIGREAFAYCSSLQSISIPDSLTHIGSSAFGHCEKLKTIYYNNADPKITQKLSIYARVVDPNSGEILAELNA